MILWPPKPSPELAGDTRKKAAGVALLYVFIIALVCAEASLFRLGERRINYPVIVALLLLMMPQTLRGLSALRELRVPSSTVVPLFAYISFCLLSATWSPTRNETIFHALILGIGMLTALGAARFRSELTLRIFVIIGSVVSVLSWLALIVAPDFALQQKGYWRLRGIMNHEFELGFLAAATLIVLAVKWVSASWTQEHRAFNSGHYALAALAAATLFATQTRTTLVYVMATLLFLGLFYARGNRRLLVVLAAIVMGSVGAFYLEDILSAFGRGEGDATLSGRTTIWARTIALAEEQPWKGYGFGSFTDPRFDFIWYRYRPPHAHNTWVMAYFETGWIGTALLSSFLFAQLVVGFGLSRRRKQPSVGLFLALFTTVSGLTSLIYGGKLSAMYCLPWLILLQEFAEAYLPRGKPAHQRRKAPLWTTTVPQTPRTDMLLPNRRTTQLINP